MANILKAKNWDPKEIVFSDVKPNNHGGKSVYINRNGGKFRVQTGEMNLPYGLGEHDILDPKTNEVIGKKYTLNFNNEFIRRLLGRGLLE